MIIYFARNSISRHYLEVLDFNNSLRLLKKLFWKIYHFFSDLSRFRAMLNSSCAIRELEGISAFSVNILSAVLGSLGNLLVCSTVYWSPRLHKAWCYFICSLSIADLMVNLVVQPMEAVLTFARMKGICDHELRDAFRLAAYITCGASLMNLAFMSVERCLAIVWPLRQRQLRHLTRRRVLFLLIIIWGVPCLLGTSGLIAGKGTRLSSILVLIGLAGCYGVILTSYGILLLKTRTHFKVHFARTVVVKEFHNKGNNSACQLSNGKVNDAFESKSHQDCSARATEKRRGSANTLAAKKRRESERRAAKTIAVVIALFTLSWVPYGYVLVTDPEQNINTFYVWAVTIGLTNSSVNPLVYFFSNNAFRKNSKRLLRSIVCCFREY